MNTLYSVGHGNRGIEALIALLRDAAIDNLIDVRAYPSSRRHPQFTRMALEPALRVAGIRYQWEGAALGGMRSPRADSPHRALTDPVMRGYADHMASAEFAAGIARLVQAAATQRAAILCAERDYRHCHRAFIADALMLAGVEVLHLVDAGDTRRHAMSDAARVEQGRLVYDAGIQLDFGLFPPG